jgi:hypothetical protein
MAKILTIIGNVVFAVAVITLAGGVIAVIIQILKMMGPQ